MNRRDFLASSAAALVHGSVHSQMPVLAGRARPVVKADHELQIEPTTLEIGNGISINTLAYNGRVPGPLLKLREGIPVTIDVTNRAQQSDLVHWHGLAIDSLNDGACEEGSPMIAPGETHRYHFTPKPAGTRWYHTHASAFENLEMATYTGQFGFLLVEGKRKPAAYDLEVNLAIHHWGHRSFRWWA
jgi:FtsP/CotA-like multicopper oxidase with cupredoxin domain